MRCAGARSLSSQARAGLASRNGAAGGYAAPALYNTVLGALGNAPVIRLQNMAPAGVDVFVKCEAFNPMLSVKDRLAVGLLEWAELNGKISKGQTVVDALRGHTGVGLAVACKQRGHPLVVAVSDQPDGRSLQRCTSEWQQLMRLLGARVIVCNEPVEVARSLAGQRSWFLARDFQPAASLWMHANSTGPDILNALGSRRLDWFIAPHGSGATLQGVGQVLREKSPQTRICVVEPDSLPHPEYTSQYGPHYSWPDEVLQGFSTDFAPKSMDSDVVAKYVDDRITVTGHESLDAARELAQSECIFTGISGGALAAGALKVAHGLPKGSSVCTVLLDTSHFHMSTPLLNGVPTEMSEEETELLRAAASDKDRRGIQFAKG